jgi:hypothetical protein
MSHREHKIKNDVIKKKMDDTSKSQDACKIAQNPFKSL